MFTFFILLVGLAASFASPVLPDQRAIGDRIVGGRNADIEEIPYQVSIMFDGSHSCGGVIISKDWVVTAAHCCQRPRSRFAIRAGSTYRTSGGSIHAVELIINHGSYQKPASVSNDIALMKVVEPFQLSSKIQPIALPKQSEEVAGGTLATISGWGVLRWMIGVTPEIVQVANVPVVSLQDCRKAYSARQVSDDMLCAGAKQGGIDACQGDSGGPLAIDNVLQGIVSWGRRCASSRYPGVYAKVSHFRDWIRENTGV